MKTGILPQLASILVLLQLLGCHTVEAISSLRHPSPVRQLTIRPEAQPASQLEWRAEYGFSAYPDNWIVGMFSRTVAHSDAWDLGTPHTICIQASRHAYSSSHFGVSQLETGVDSVAFKTPSERMKEPGIEALESAQRLGCTHVLYATKSDQGRLPYATGVHLLAVEGGTPEVLALPEERPLRDPRRWGWLAAGPILDVVTIVAAVPTLAVLGVADLYETLQR